jgi:hypothetical protein
MHRKNIENYRQEQRKIDVINVEVAEAVEDA